MSTKNDSPPPRRRRLAGDAREHILAAAEDVLVADGPQQLKLTEVARAAGVSNSAVLHHFGSITEVQTALMERMVSKLMEKVLVIVREPGELPSTSLESLLTLFDLFESRGAARLAAWLELTGESRRLTVVRTAVRAVIDQRAAQFPAASVEALEDFILAGIALALGVGLFGATLGELLGKPDGHARTVALALLASRLQHAYAPA